MYRNNSTDEYAGEYVICIGIMALMNMWESFTLFLIESSLLINNQIHSHNTMTNNQMSILRMNRSKTKHCVLHNGLITWNSLPDVFKVNVSFSMFKSEIRNCYLEKY